MCLVTVPFFIFLKEIYLGRFVSLTVLDTDAGLMLKRKRKWNHLQMVHSLKLMLGKLKENVKHIS